MVPQYI
jgi:hypothetical protein